MRRFLRATAFMALGTRLTLFVFQEFLRQQFIGAARAGARHRTAGFATRAARRLLVTTALLKFSLAT